MDMRKLVARNLKKYRTEMGLSQEELAARSGVDRTYISGLERGVRNPTVVMLWQIASALNVEPWRLIYPDSPAEE
jgi:transcriptional regulator with XRE-family HTH domain